MSKKTNTIVFILLGTVVNLLFTFLFILVSIFLIGLLIPVLGDQVGMLLPFVVIVAIILSMIVYQYLSRWVIKRFNLADKMEPLFTGRRKRH